MAGSTIPEEVQRFIAEQVDSAEQLDALMLLHAKSERAWTPEEVAQSIFSVPQSSARTLDRLEQQGFVRREAGDPPSYRYGPATPEHDRQVNELAEAYRTNRAEVVKLVFVPRADPVRSLAEAFRLRKD